MSAPVPQTSGFSRRDFLRATVIAGAGLTVGVYVAGCGPSGDAAGGAAAAAGDGWAPNAFVRVGTDGQITVISKHLEMGQGAYTGLATIIADELDADWSKVVVEGAPADASRYGNALFGGQMGTGGSSSIASSWEPYRKAGATARAMLVQAAAKEWGADAASLRTADGTVSDPASGKSLGYGELAAKAAALPVPQDAPLKSPEQYRFIGKDGAVKRTDRVAKTTGKAVYTQDVRLDGMLVAVVAHPPRFGATVKSVDDAKARAVPGVKHVVQIPTGVAVVADTFWSARQGRDALAVTWDESKAFDRSSDGLLAEYRELAAKPGPTAKKVGDVDAAFASATTVVEARYELPFLAHATMEPMNCVVRLDRDGGCDIWTGAQTQTSDQGFVAKLLGVKPEQVRMQMTYAGGSFGRRANPAGDYVVEAVSIAKAIKGTAPVKMVWTREDDMRAGWYRPAYVHAFKAALGADGLPTAWQQHVVGQSILIGTSMEAFAVKDGIDFSSLEGAVDLPYKVPNHLLQLTSPTLPVPVQWWRSVGHTHTGFADESFIDELAHAAKQDPYAYRLKLLADAPRHVGVLTLAAEKAGWGTPLPKGRARGIAVHKSFDSYVAHVAEVSVENGRVRVHRIVSAVDCGVVVNPDVVRAQVEGAVAYGLSAALHDRITFTNGVVDQPNFDRHPVLRLPEAPVVEVHLVPSTEKPTGIGEPGLPPAAPAVANAVFALTGKRLRSMPFALA